MTGAGEGCCAGADMDAFHRPIDAGEADQDLRSPAGGVELSLIKDLLTRNGTEPDLRAVPARELELLKR